MTSPLTERAISAKLGRAWRPGEIASTDGYANLTGGAPLKCAAVLLPLIRLERAWRLVFTRRTDTVESHKGQVSFPGGQCDSEHEQPEQAALREAQEEIGLRPDDVRLLGRLNDIVTITHYRVTPVVGTFRWPYEFHPSPLEVARIFTIPLEWLARRENRVEQYFTPQGENRPFPVVIYQPYDGEVLWGASARIVLEFLAVLGMLEDPLKPGTLPG
ncbi:MAG: CoA pyrophosphatase [Chloroflexi bacterium]|nr:CoA pyrophosphatase [Chloroflexota bacterium]